MYEVCSKVHSLTILHAAPSFDSFVEEPHHMPPQHLSPRDAVFTDDHRYVSEENGYPPPHFP